MRLCKAFLLLYLEYMLLNGFRPVFKDVSLTYINTVVKKGFFKYLKFVKTSKAHIYLCLLHLVISLDELNPALFYSYVQCNEIE